MAAMVIAALQIIVLAAACAQDLSDEEDQPIDEDAGGSTVDERTLGALPNPLERWGIKFAATYIGETLASKGGAGSGFSFQGRLNLAVDADLEKAAGAKGLTFHANAFAIHGDRFSDRFVQSFSPVSGIEGLGTVRLFEAWFEQKIADGKMSLRAGQLSADAEFITTRFSDIFTNATFTWPTLTAVALPSGGPATPLATPGARLRVKLTDSVSAMLAVYNGDPAGPGEGDPQQRNRYGVNFRVNDPPLYMAQLDFDWSQLFGKKTPGSFKIGGFYHAGSFDHTRLAADGRSLADPASSGTAAILRSDSGVFGVIEQKLITKADDKDRGIGVFARTIVSPPDRNRVDYYADAGVQFAGWFDSRPNDKFGIAVAYAHVPRIARGLDSDFRVYVDPSWPRRNYEALLTATYAYEVQQGWTVQPNAQLISRPGGGASDPIKSEQPGRRLGNALVVGLRSTLKF